LENGCNLSNVTVRHRYAQLNIISYRPVLIYLTVNINSWKHSWKQITGIQTNWNWINSLNNTEHHSLRTDMNIAFSWKLTRRQRWWWRLKITKLSLHGKCATSKEKTNNDDDNVPKYYCKNVGWHFQTLLINSIWLIRLKIEPKLPKQ